MSHWVWFSKVSLFGLVGTSAIVPFFASSLSQNTNLAEAEATYASSQSLSEDFPKARVPITHTPPFPNLTSTSQQVSVPSFDLNQSLSLYSPLFETPTALGMLAIGAAEGNYRVFVQQQTLYVQQTRHYFGHTDPGNLSWGEVVTNYGPCSDQGRSKGNIAEAEKWCSQRALSALPEQLKDLSAAGINPNTDLEAVLNTADLYNQASPIHSKKFPEALKIAQRGGLRGSEAIAWARTASFYLNANNELDVERGRNRASGLIGICARQNRWVTEWQCVYNDQVRRVNAISEVLRLYSSVSNPPQS